MGKVLARRVSCQQDDAFGGSAARGDARRPSRRRRRNGARCRRPTPGPTQSIGFYTAGCLQGAQALPLDGPGYEAIRISRNRYWGQPVTLDFIKTLSEKVRAAGQAPLYIGDIGQPRGGPAPSGHASHQTGLDADIWFERQPGAAARAGRPREPAAALAGARRRRRHRRHGLHPAACHACCGWRAEMPHLDRLFVNKWIKQRLCQTRHRQPRLAAQARGLGRPRRAFPRQALLPARQSAVPAAGRLLRGRRLRRAARSLVHPPAGHAAAARCAAARPTGPSCRRRARRC